MEMESCNHYSHYLTIGLDDSRDSDSRPRAANRLHLPLHHDADAEWVSSIIFLFLDADVIGSMYDFAQADWHRWWLVVKEKRNRKLKNKNPLSKPPEYPEVVPKHERPS